MVILKTAIGISGQASLGHHPAPCAHRSRKRVRIVSRPGSAARTDEDRSAGAEHRKRPCRLPSVIRGSQPDARIGVDEK